MSETPLRDGLERLTRLVAEWREHARLRRPLETAKISAGKRARTAEYIWYTNRANEVETILETMRRAVPPAPHQLPELDNALIGKLHAMNREQILDWLGEQYEAEALLAVPPAQEAAPRWDALNRGLEALMPAQAPPAPPDDEEPSRDWLLKRIEWYSATLDQVRNERDALEAAMNPQDAGEALAGCAAARPSPRAPSPDLAAQIRALPRHGDDYGESFVFWADLAALLPPADGPP